jgi:hypothetical protein
MQTAELLFPREFDRSAAIGFDDAGVEQQHVRRLGTEDELQTVRNLLAGIDTFTFEQLARALAVSNSGLT